MSFWFSISITVACTKGKNTFIFHIYAPFIGVVMLQPPQEALL